MPRINFMNITIDNLTMAEAVASIDQLVIKRTPSYVVTPNVDHLMKLQKDPEFQQVYESADLILTDGKPLLWIADLYKTPIKEKVSGSDLFPELCQLAADRGYNMFFLGAMEGIAARAAENLTRRFPGLHVTGTYSPPYGFEKDPAQVAEICEMVQAAKTDILIVGLGCPKQEKFIYNHLAELNVPVSLGLGASIDFEAGNIKRAPKWMRDHGLEWAYRITQDPKRLLKRYLEDFMVAGLIFKYRPRKQA